MTNQFITNPQLRKALARELWAGRRVFNEVKAKNPEAALDWGIYYTMQQNAVRSVIRQAQINLDYPNA